MIPAFILAIASMGFVAGLTFQATPAGTIMVTGIAAIGWAVAAAATASSHHWRTKSDSLCERIRELLTERTQGEERRTRLTVVPRSQQPGTAA